MTNRTQTLTTLATRAEQAGVEEQAVLLGEAALRIAVKSWTPVQKWRWHKLMELEAFTDAAMMLKPVGWGLLVNDGYDDRTDGSCDVNVNWVEDGYLEHAHAQAATPALALLAAICKAVAQGEGQ